jgi:hypothetical protein
MRQFTGLLLLMVTFAVFGQQSVIVTPIDGDAQTPDPAVPRETTVDLSFRFGDTNVGNIRDIELFPDGRIAYGGVRGWAAAIGTVTEDGIAPPWHFGGINLAVAQSVAVDAKDRAVFGGGISRSDLAVFRVVNIGDDYSWSHQSYAGGNVSKVLKLRDRDVLVAGNLTLRGRTNESFGLVRLDLGGGLDAGFDLSGAAGLTITCAALTADGRILAGYKTTNDADASRYGVGRWESNGKYDADYERFNLWATSFGTNSQVTVIEKAPGTNGFVVPVQTEPIGSGGPKVTRISRLDETGLPVDSFESYIQGGVNAIAFEAVRPETVATRGI